MSCEDDAMEIDSSVWSVHTASNVGKSSFLENSSLNNFKKTSARTSSSRRRRTLAIGDSKFESLSVLLTPNVDVNEADKDDLPPTQPSGPLSDVIAYVDVYSGKDNHSRYIANVIRDLGATVCQRFTTKVTHVIFRDGLQSTLERARARKIPCVSVLWIDSCIKENKKVSEDLYKIRDVDETGAPMIVGKLRKPRCVHSGEDFDIAVVLSDKRVKKRVKRAEAYRLMKEITNFKIVEESPPTSTAIVANPSDTILACDTPDNNNLATHQFANSANYDWRALTETFTPDSLRAQLDELKLKVAEILGTPDSDDDSESDSLAANVKRKLFEPGGILYGTPPPAFLGNSSRSSLQRDDKYPSTTTPKTKNFKSNKISVEYICEVDDDLPLTPDECFIKRREFVVRDSTEEILENNLVPCSSSLETEKSHVVDDIVRKTQCMELKSPIPERKIPQRSITPTSADNVEIDLSPRIVNSIDLPVGNVAILTEEENEERKTCDAVRFDGELLKTATEQQPVLKSQSDISSVDDYSSVSVGPVVVVQRKKSSVQQTQMIHVAVNTPTVRNTQNVSNADRHCMTKSNRAEPSLNESSKRPIIDEQRKQPIRQAECKSKRQQPKVVAHRKQLFNEFGRNAVRLSPMEIVADASTVSSKSSASSLSLIEKIANGDTLTKDDITAVFEPPSLFAAKKTVAADSRQANDNAKPTAAATQRQRNTKRLRSSLFYVKTPYAVANELQMGRPSPEEFLSFRSTAAVADKKKTRRRTVAATTATTTSVKRIGKNGAGGRPSVVLTSVTGSNRDTVCAAVKKLGKFKLENKITERTSHVISGDGRRTLTVLHGLVRGCYVLSLDWVTKSLENGKWLDEKRFEFPIYQSIGTGNHKRKYSFLKSVGPVYVDINCKPPVDDMKSLIKTCNGKLASTAKRSQVCIGNVKNRENIEAVVVAERWLLGVQKWLLFSIN